MEIIRPLHPRRRRLRCLTGIWTSIVLWIVRIRVFLVEGVCSSIDTVVLLLRERCLAMAMCSTALHCYCCCRRRCELAAACGGLYRAVKGVAVATAARRQEG
uniref:Uncharacterized protein n=1 Tax=Arundo donax TaxID=35708 RepID=A0A0A9PME1_ARUDO